MMPDWQTLFAPRPLSGRAVRLELPEQTGPMWFAFAGAEDLRTLPTEAFLTPAEQARAAAFKFGQPRENFTLGRLAGKLAVAGPLTPTLSPSGGEGGELACQLRAFEITNGARGEPVVRAGNFQSPLSSAAEAPVGGWKPPAPGVSLSHVNGRGVAVAFPTGARVGLDLELIDPQRAETVRKGVPLSAVEEAWLKATPLPEPTALLALWTAREALGKALGCGWACAWPTLALGEIGTIGPGWFLGRFEQHPEFSCVGWLGPDAVMAIALAPAE